MKESKICRNGNLQKNENFGEGKFTEKNKNLETEN